MTSMTSNDYAWMNKPQNSDSYFGGTHTFLTSETVVTEKDMMSPTFQDLFQKSPAKAKAAISDSATKAFKEREGDVKESNNSPNVCMSSTIRSPTFKEVMSPARKFQETVGDPGKKPLPSNSSQAEKPRAEKQRPKPRKFTFTDREITNSTGKVYIRGQTKNRTLYSEWKPSAYYW